MFEKKKVALLVIATNKYTQFVPPLYKSVKKHFLVNHDVKVVVFTDGDVPENESIIKIHQEHLEWPYSTMFRFKIFNKSADLLKDFDYLFYIDADTLIVDDINEDILGDLVGVRHCGFYNGGGTFENNPKSVFYVKPSDPKQHKYYFGGGFSGGKSDKYLELSSWCEKMIDEDLKNNIVPIFHDETSINLYFLYNEPSIILDPSYHYPQGNIEYFKSRWKPYDFSPKILLLDKNHNEIRK